MEGTLGNREVGEVQGVNFTGEEIDWSGCLELCDKWGSRKDGSIGGVEVGRVGNERKRQRKTVPAYRGKKFRAAISGEGETHVSKAGC